MLTDNLVETRRRGVRLELTAFDARKAARVRELGAAYLDLARAHIGLSRQEWKESAEAVPFAPHELRLAGGVRKLVDDICEIDCASEIDPIALRDEILSAAALQRKADTFDRKTIIAAAAEQHAVSIEAIERALYADLQSEHLVQSVAPLSVDELVRRYDLGRIQAVLLRAVRVTIQLDRALPATYRRLFRKLKFLRLLHHIRRTDAGYEISIDGPFSLFESVTRYGLQLALLVPILEECGTFRLTAEVRWGKLRTPLHFSIERSGMGARAPAARHPFCDFPDEVAALGKALLSSESRFKVAPAKVLLDLPGVGLCVPDLEFTDRESGTIVYLEVLGYWSRDAVWKRVELVEKGMPERILFAVSHHLRVSEAALDESLPSSLHVYARTLQPAAILERVTKLAER